MKKKEFIRLLQRNKTVRTSINQTPIKEEVIEISDNFFYKSTPFGYGLHYKSYGVMHSKSVEQIYKITKKNNINKDRFVDKISQVRAAITLSLL